MKVKYDREVDIIYVALSDETVFESDEEKKGVILDYSADGRIEWANEASLSPDTVYLGSSVIGTEELT